MISLYFVQFGRNCWVGTIAYTVHCDVVMIDWWCIKGRSAILIMMVPGRKIKSAEVEQVVVPRAFSNAAKFRSSLAWKLKYTTITDCDICRLLSTPNAPQLSLKHTEWQENVGFFFRFLFLGLCQTDSFKGESVSWNWQVQTVEQKTAAMGLIQITLAISCYLWPLTEAELPSSYTVTCQSPDKSWNMSKKRRKKG